MKKEKLLTTGEAASRLGVTPKTIARWAKMGKIRAVFLPSGRIKIPEDEVEKILKELDPSR